MKTPFLSTDRRRTLGTLALALPLFFVFSHPARADDWLQWGGPAGDFTVQVEGLAEWWPADGPRVLWNRPLGEGYSSILFKDARLFTMYRDGDEEVVVSLDARTGATLWEHRYGVEIWPDMTPAFGLGPNATPLIVGDRIVSISIDGQVRCLDLSSGELKWKHDLPAEYGRRKRDEEYGYSNHPMHYEGKAIVLVGGTDHAVVAFDPADGSTHKRGSFGHIPHYRVTYHGSRRNNSKSHADRSPRAAIGCRPPPRWFRCRRTASH